MLGMHWGGEVDRHRVGNTIVAAPGALEYVRVTESKGRVTEDSIADALPSRARENVCGGLLGADRTPPRPPERRGCELGG